MYSLLLNSTFPVRSNPFPVPLGKGKGNPCCSVPFPFGERRGKKGKEGKKHPLGFPFPSPKEQGCFAPGRSKGAVEKATVFHREGNPLPLLLLLNLFPPVPSRSLPLGGKPFGRVAFSFPSFGGVLRQARV